MLPPPIYYATPSGMLTPRFRQAVAHAMADRLMRVTLHRPLTPALGSRGR